MFYFYMPCKSREPRRVRRAVVGTSKTKHELHGRSGIVTRLLGHDECCMIQLDDDTLRHGGELLKTGGL